MTEYKTLGFIGLGVMGEPICPNLVKKSGKRVVVFDLSTEPLQRLRADGAEIAGSVADVIKQSDVLFLCLPSAKHVRAVFEGDGILNNIRSGQVVVDLGTSSVSQTRDFAGQLQAKGAAWADAPIARTRQVAQDGTLSVMVGATFGDELGPNVGEANANTLIHVLDDALAIGIIVLAAYGGPNADLHVFILAD